jgi:hypothetical protein
MAPPKGHPRSGGRRKGISNIALQRRELALQEAMAGALTPEQVAELSPLEVMRAVMRERFRAGDHAGALAAAAVAAPYVHARLAMSEVNVHHSTANRSDAEIAVEIEALRRRIEAARAVEVVPNTALIEAQPVQSIGVSAASPEGEQVGEPEPAKVSE